MSNRVALLELFKSTAGERWKNDLNWCSNLRYHLWFGIRVDEAGCVAVLDLTNNDLEGCIPDNKNFCCSLSNLRCLYLSSNALRGYIPSNIGSLTSLEELNLSWNKLEGKRGQVTEQINSRKKLRHCLV